MKRLKVETPRSISIQIRSELEPCCVGPNSSGFDERCLSIMATINKKNIGKDTKGKRLELDDVGLANLGDEFLPECEEDNQDNTELENEDEVFSVEEEREISNYEDFSTERSKDESEELEWEEEDENDNLNVVIEEMENAKVAYIDLD